MNALTKEESTALTLPERASVALGSPAHEVKLRELVKASASILTVTNKAGREECHSAYMVLKNTRVNINHTVEEVTEDAKKFTKAVKTEATRLLMITLAEEERLQNLRDAWDDAEQARKDALIAAERTRVENIERIIGALVAIPASYSMATAAGLADVIAEYDGWTVGVEGAEFEEFADKAAAAVAASLVTLRDMLTAKQQAEAAALSAEQARIAEAARIEAEKAELAAQRAENERIANELAIERKKQADLAAAQEAAAAKLRAEAEANLQAERDAQAKVAAESKRQMEAQQAAIAEQSRKLAEQQAAADKRDADAAQAVIDAASRDADHGPALAMNAAYDAAQKMKAEDEAERVRLQALAEQAASDAHEPAPTLEDLLDQVDAGEMRITDLPLQDAEIIDLIMETFNLPRGEAIDRLEVIDFAAARAELA